MNAKTIILAAMLAFMPVLTATAEVENPSAGTRVDYINAKGERFYSKLIEQSNEPLFHINRGDNVWNVNPPMTFGDYTTANSVRFVPWGTESYEVNLDTEVPMEYYVKSSETQKSVRLRANSQDAFKVRCGDVIVVEIELPDNAFPVIQEQGEYTDCLPNGEEYWNTISKVPFFELRGVIVNPMLLTDTDNFKEKTTYWIEGNPNISRLPTNDRCNNRWSCEIVMQNQPLAIKIGYGYADSQQLTRTVQNILYSTLYTQHNITTPDNSGENWVLRNVGEMLSEWQINGLGLLYGNDIMSMGFWPNANSATGGYSWSNYYCGILLNNMLLDNMEKFNNVSETDRNIARAQLLSLRAHCYTRILQIFGKRWSESDDGKTMCAPLILDTEDIQQPLATMADIKTQCENDLNEAIRIFDNANYRQSTLIEPDLNVARGLLMRLALCTEDWQTARDMAQQIVADVPLSTNQDMLSGFYKRSDSWLWGASTYIDENVPNDVNRHIYYYAPHNWDACNGSYGSGWGIGPNAIDRDLWLKIPEKDMRRELFVMPEVLPQPLNNVKDWYSAEYYPSDRNLFVNDASKIIEFYEDKRPETNAFKKDGYSFNIPFGAQLKFWGTGTSYCYDFSDKDGGTLFMRSDEALLTQAEACWHLGDEATARELLTQLNSMRDEEYSCTATGQDLLDEIRLYRRIEFWGEGFSWFDQKRWNLPISRNLWREGDKASGNWPEGVTANVGTSEANGWRALIPAYYVKQNPNIDLSKMEYVDAIGYEGDFITGFVGYDYNSEFNLWTKQHLSQDDVEFYYAPGWTQIKDLALAFNGDELKVTFPKATDDHWQAQMHVKTQISVPAGQLMDGSIIISSNTAITDATCMIHPYGDDANAFYPSEFGDKKGYYSISLRGGETKAFFFHDVPAPVDMNNLVWTFDFGGCPENTKITIRNFILKKSSDDDGTIIPEAPNTEAAVRVVDDRDRSIVSSLSIASGFNKDANLMRAADTRLQENGSGDEVTLSSIIHQ